MIKPIGKLDFPSALLIRTFENSTAPTRHLKSGGSFYQYSLIMLLTSKILFISFNSQSALPICFLSLSPLRSQAPLCPSWRFSVRLLQYSPYVPEHLRDLRQNTRAVFNLHPKEEFIFTSRNLLRGCFDNMYSLSVRCIRIQFLASSITSLQPRFAVGISPAPLP